MKLNSAIEDLLFNQCGVALIKTTDECSTIKRGCGSACGWGWILPTVRRAWARTAFGNNAAARKRFPACGRGIFYTDGGGRGDF